MRTRQVIPRVPVRQWVLAFPFDLHHRLACDTALESRLLSLFIEELTEHREPTGEPSGVPGTVTFLQHFGSTLNLHVYFHVLALNGVYLLPATGGCSGAGGALTPRRFPASTKNRNGMVVNCLIGLPTEAATTTPYQPEPELWDWNTLTTN